MTQCTYLSDTLPLSNILIHGLIRDSQNRKMSKSLNNGIEPNEVISKYGADALRIFLIATASLGEDLRYDEQKIVYYTNFINKFYNVNEFIKFHHLTDKNESLDLNNLNLINA